MPNWLRWLLFIGLSLFNHILCIAAPLRLVAAENFYASVAQEIGGKYVQTLSILQNVKQNPHLFSSSPSTARLIASADIVIINGANYDAWMEPLISNQKNPLRQTINVAQLMNQPAGSNPHIWYNPNTMLVFARHLARILEQREPAHQAYFAKQLQHFSEKHARLLKKIALLKQKFQGTSILATEPIFNEMASAIGLSVKGLSFQLSIMNEIEPSPRQIAEFENLLKQRSVRVLIYNQQVIAPFTERMRKLALKSKVPVLGVHEIMPAGYNYFSWMRQELYKLKCVLEQ